MNRFAVTFLVIAGLSTLALSSMAQSNVVNTIKNNLLNPNGALNPAHPNWRGAASSVLSPILKPKTTTTGSPTVTVTPMPAGGGVPAGGSSTVVDGGTSSGRTPIVDRNGQLLYYTDGDKLFDKNGKPIALIHNESVFTNDGHQLGFYADGTLMDNDGKTLGTAAKPKADKPASKSDATSNVTATGKTPQSAKTAEG